MPSTKAYNELRGKYASLSKKLNALEAENKLLRLNGVSAPIIAEDRKAIAVMELLTIENEALRRAFTKLVEEQPTASK